MGQEDSGDCKKMKHIELQNLTIKEAAKLLRGREISALELTESYLNSAKEKNKKNFAFLELFAKNALAQAKKVDERRREGEELSELAGIPIALKDNLLVYNQVASSGSKILENFKAPYSATVVKKLKKQGAVVLGRTNMDEFAMGSSTENSAFGPTRNPHDPTRVPGGSSGGSAAAVAGDMCLGALGSDTGGSIRQPAALCGVVGLKPTYGAVSRYGLMAAASSLDQIGPFGKTVEDTEAIFKAICGMDPKDSTAAKYEYEPAVGLEIKKIRIGLPKEFFGPGLNEEVAKNIKSLAGKLEKAGAEIIEISLPHFEYGLPCYYIVMPSEVSANLARYDGIRFGLSERNEKSIGSVFFNSRSRGLGAEVKRRIMIGTYALSSGYYDAYYLRAQKVRDLIRQDLAKAFEKVDFILGPTTPTTAFKLGEKTDDPVSMYLADLYTVSVNLAGVPALSLPSGFDSQNLPIGAQLIAGHFQENKLLAFAKKTEELIAD